MAKTTFSGPVRSRRGFISAGPDAVVNITAETTLTFDDHAGRLIEINDADGAVTLPTISADSNSSTAGADDPNVNSHLGAVYKFFIGTDATDLDIKTDGTDKFVGSLAVGVDDGSYKVFQPAASNDVISMNGGTQGGDKNSYVEITALADNEYLVQGVLIGSGTIATPFADS
mgnify:FL=1|jgi:hypothetical protein|tara:strand:+ start:654 stop:1169 length:516 start_codon:yes stop_codon:yes gene_type:complete